MGQPRFCFLFQLGWLTVRDHISVYWQFHERDSTLLLSMDIRKSPAEQDMALISFYKRPCVKWGRPELQT